jgi:hypothetical protein
MRFQPGDRVQVRAARPPGHVRTPWSIRGRVGVVERCCGAYGNPEQLAYGRSGEPRQPLYRVRFRQRGGLYPLFVLSALADGPAAGLAQEPGLSRAGGQ